MPQLDTTSRAAIQPDGKIVWSGTHSLAFSKHPECVGAAELGRKLRFYFVTKGIVTNNLPAGTSGPDFLLTQPDGIILAIEMANGGNGISLARHLAP